MKDKIYKLNKLYEPIIKNIELISRWLVWHKIDHSLGFYNNNKTRIGKELLNKIYPIPVIFCKLNNLKVDIGLDLATNETYLGFIKFTLNKKEVLSFDFDLLKDFDFKVYGIDYYKDIFYWEHLKKSKSKIKESKETRFRVNIDISALNQIKTFIEKMSTKPKKVNSFLYYICECRHQIAIDTDNGKCPICGKDSPLKRKFKTKCPVCEKNALKDKYGNGKCETCGWKIDKISKKRKDEVIYPNLISLNKAKRLYQEGKPFTPDLNDFMEMLYFYSEVEFWYKGLNCCATLREDNKIEFGWNPGNVYYFADKDDFIKNAKIGDVYVKDIWDKVENPKYI